MRNEKSKEMMGHKNIAAAVALLMLTAPLAGCGGQGSGTGQASASSSATATESAEPTSGAASPTPTETTDSASSDSASSGITVDGVTFDGARRYTGGPGPDGYDDIADCESSSEAFSEYNGDGPLAGVDDDNGKLVVTLQTRTSSYIGCLLERPDAHFELTYANDFKSAANRVVDFSSTAVMLGSDSTTELTVTIPYTRDECSDDIDAIAQRYASNPEEFQLKFFYGNAGDSDASAGTHNASDDAPSSTMETYRNVLYGFHAQVPDNFTFAQGGARTFSTAYVGSGVNVGFSRQPKKDIRSAQDALDYLKQEMIHDKGTDAKVTEERIDGQNAYLTYEADGEAWHERMIVTGKQVLNAQVVYNTDTSEKRAVGERVAGVILPTLAEN